MKIVSVLYVVYDGYDTDSRDAEILLTTEDEHEAIRQAKGLNGVVFRYDVTDDENLINEKLIYSG